MTSDRLAIAAAVEKLRRAERHEQQAAELHRQARLELEQLAGDAGALAARAIYLSEPNSDEAGIERQLLERAKQLGMSMTSDGRVSEKDATILLNYAPGTLKKKRLAGDAPEHSARGMAGAKITYYVSKLAAWLVAGKKVDSWTNGY